MKRLLLILLLAAVFAAGFLSIRKSSGNDRREDSRDRIERSSDALEALEFWTRSRAFPQADIPANKYYSAYRYAKEKMRPAPKSAFGFSSWKCIGPLNLQGRAISVALNPLNPNTIYVGSASGGLWRSYTDGLAQDWERITLGYPALGVSAIAIEPSDSNTMYVGTGEVYRYQVAVSGLVIRTTRGSYGIGILKTTDGGQTWSKSLDWSYNQQEGIQALRLNPHNPRTVFAATTDGVYRSFDAGATWTNLGPTVMAEDILINPLDTNLVLISCGNFGLGSGLFRSTNEGSSWTTIDGMVSSFSGKTLLDYFKANPNTVFASVADSTTGATGLWRSRDFGLNWTLLNSDGIAGVQGWYSHFVAVHPVDSMQVVHAGVSIYKSVNGGVTFTGSAGSYSDHHSFTVDPTNPDILYVVNDDGIYRSTNFGASYQSVGLGLLTGQLYNGASNSSTDSLLVLTQSQDHIPGYLYTGTTTWQISATDEVGWTAIDQTNDNIMYAEGRNGSYVVKSTDRGSSFAQYSGFSGSGGWNTPFILSRSNPNTLYLIDQRPYKSTSGGSGWFVTNGGSQLDGNPALSVAMSAVSPDTVYVGMAPLVTNMHLFRTTNGGTTWTNVTGILPNRYPLDIAVDPHNAAIVYVSFGGFDPGHLFKSTNAGANWFDITGTLPEIPTGAVLVDPLVSNNIYVGNDFGAYASTDGGTTWNSFGEGLPEALLAADLIYTPSNRTLRLVTHGNGVYERKLPLSYPALILDSPSGGELWQVGTVHQISWSSAFVKAVRLDYSTDGGISWTAIADSLSPVAASYNWTIPGTLTGNARVRVTSLADTTLRSVSGGMFTIFASGVFASYPGGWNLVSLPMSAADPRKSTIFPAALTPLYAYHGSYVMVDTLVPGVGYWLKTGSDSFVSFSGDTVEADTIPVGVGWNIVGSVTQPVAVSQVSTVPPGIISSQFFGYARGYKMADTIRPGRGYWVKTSGAGALMLSSSSIISPLVHHVTEEVESFNSLTVTDLAGQSQTLYFGRSPRALDVSRYELPPRGPANFFDVRFSSNMIVQTCGENGAGDMNIEIAGALQPVTVRWDVRDAERYVLQTADGRTHEMSGPGALQLDHPTSTLLLQAQGLGVAPVPTTFGLRQNFPNPFNPATVIGFDVPTASRVHLGVYDLLGREVVVLVDGERGAGSYSVQADMSGRASGIYIYRLDAGNRVYERKMLLLK